MIQCTFENEIKASLRHVTVGTIIENTKGEVLLVKRAPHLLRGNMYTIPGGFLDRDETAEEAALRELKEETGLIGKISFLFRINDSPHRPKEDRQNVDFVYIAKVTGGEITANSETTQIAWFTKESLPLDEEFAFDHRDSLLRYFAYKEKQCALPIIG